MQRQPQKQERPPRRARLAASWPFDFPLAIFRDFMRGIATSGMAGKSVVVALFLMAAPAPAHAATYYVANDGDDSNPGTIGQPLATIQKAQEFVGPGDTVYVRGGTYHMSESQIATVKSSLFACLSYIDKSGTEGAMINYWAYPGETPIFDLSDVKPANERVVGFYVAADWIHFKGLEVTGVQVTITTHTESYCFYSYGSDNIFESLKLHDNQGTGLRHWSGANNLFLNCDSYRNWDYTSEDGKGGNTDGFGCHPPVGDVGNVFRGCRSWFNSDDGYDVLGAKESVTLENCWSFYNGYSTTFQSLGDGNGFKGGGYRSETVDQLPNPIPRHLIEFCLAVRNKANGFYSNHHIGGSDWLNNSAYRNSVDFNMLSRLSDNVTNVPGYGHKLRNNLGYKGGHEIENIDYSQCDASNDSFDMSVNVTDDDFESLDESLLTAPRQADGSLPNVPFMKLKATSDLIDKGVDIGFPFNGAAPDLGAFEFTIFSPAAAAAWSLYR
jgi:hypothetical protein